MSWQQSTIDEACLLVTDGTHYTPPDVGQGIPFLTVKDFSNDGYIDLVGCSHITENEFEKAERANSAPKRGDVLFSKDGTVGKVYVVDTRETFAVLSSLAILRPDASRLDASYFGRVLKTDSCLDQASQSKTGSAIRRIILKDLKRVRFPLPPLAEQKRIAAILDAADAVRAKRRETLAQLDTLIQSTFLDMFGDPVTNPMGWDTFNLEQVGQVITGNTPSRKRPEYYGDNIEWIKSDNINDPSVFLTEAEERLSVAGKAVARTTPKGSILVTCIAGSPACIGNAAIADREVAFNQQINAFVPGERIRSWFAIGMFLVGKRLVQSASTNAMKGMVSKSAFSAVSVPVPPMSLQSRFAAIFESINQQKASQRAHLAELDTLFASLQSRAFRGDL